MTTLAKVERTKSSKAKRRDRIARWIITAGGILVIASVIAIVVLIVGVTLPLFLPARASQIAEATLPESVPAERILAVGIDLGIGDRHLVAHLVEEDGQVRFLDIPFDGSAARLVGEERILPPSLGKGGVVPPRVPEEGEKRNGDPPAGLGEPIGPQRVGEQGVVSAESPEQVEPTASSPVALRAVEHFDGALYTLLWEDGSAALVEIEVTTAFDASGIRSVHHQVHRRAALAAEDADRDARRAIVRVAPDGTVTCSRLLPDNTLSVVREEVRTSLFGDEERIARRLVLRERIPGTITALSMDRQGSILYAGTDNGCLVYWRFGAAGDVVEHDVIPAFPDERTVTALSVVFGDMSLAVGDATGGLSTWFFVRGEGGNKLRPIHTLRAHEDAVREIFPTRRRKTLLSASGGGQIHLDYPTSRRHLLSLDAPDALAAIAFSTRGDAVAALDEAGTLHVWRIENPHPEISLPALFGRVHYEGYPEPDFVWQSIGGDDFEPKYSLTPLLFGTLKGTFYAMLLAVPLALFAAVYTSHFTTPGFRRAIKPVVELMAAIPSVVVGFLAALWLAPLLERWVLSVFLSFATVPLCFVAFLTFWQGVRRLDWAKRVENGYEFVALLPVVFGGLLLAAWLTAPLEGWLFGGDFRQWLFDFMEMRYDQRNSMVIALALGFAVIPIIFSISEDSLSNVPHSLSAASLAMGASRWQTLWRVVLPSASPGIFAAIMIGFGRAVGETMIVLMATGNTPIIDWSPFNGMRTLSANIAQEIPEAPHGGTLYRILFLCAVLLFTLTFLLNTAAELVRQHLRKQYGRF